MPDFLKPYISRVVASLVAGLVGFLAAKNINLDADTQTQAIAAITGLVTTLFGVVYAVIHKLLDKVVNPGDGAAQANIAHGHALKDGSA